MEIKKQQKQQQKITGETLALRKSGIKHKTQENKRCISSGGRKHPVLHIIQFEVSMTQDKQNMQHTPPTTISSVSLVHDHFIFTC